MADNARENKKVSSKIGEIHVQKVIRLYCRDYCVAYIKEAKKNRMAFPIVYRRRKTTVGQPLITDRMGRIWVNSLRNLSLSS